MALHNEKYNCIGIVKVLTELWEEKYYIGVGQWLNEQRDAEFIAMNWSPYSPNIIN